MQTQTTVHQYKNKQPVRETINSVEKLRIHIVLKLLYQEQMNIKHRSAEIVP